jgi:hypothetical protein
MEWRIGSQGHLRLTRGKDEEICEKFDESTKRFVDFLRRISAKGRRTVRKGGNGLTKAEI